MRFDENSPPPNGVRTEENGEREEVKERVSLVEGKEGLIRAADMTRRSILEAKGRDSSPLTLQGFRPRQFVVIRVACIDSCPTRPTSGYLV